MSGGITHLSVRSRSRAGFRRAGRAFTHTPTVIDVTELSKAQLDAITKDPQLIAVPATEDEIKAATPKAKPEGGKAAGGKPAKGAGK